MFIHRSFKSNIKNVILRNGSYCLKWNKIAEHLLSPTSCPRSMAHSLADWALASTMTLNIVQMDCGTRKSVPRLLL